MQIWNVQNYSVGYVLNDTGVDFSNAVLDRVNFGKANLEGAVFKNTVLSGSTFDEAQLQNADFEDTIIGYIDLQKLCTNTTLSPDGRAELGCRWDDDHRVVRLLCRPWYTLTVLSSPVMVNNLFWRKMWVISFFFMSIVCFIDRINNMKRKAITTCELHNFVALKNL